MPSGISYALTQALGLNRPNDPVADKAAAARAALDSIVGGMGVAPLAEIGRTPAPQVQQTATPALGGSRGGYSSGGGLRGGGSWDVGNVPRLASMFGLRMTSGYRSPEHNRAVGGVPNSRHLSGRAQDYAGSPAQMRMAAAWARANGATEVLIHNAGSGTHLHVGW